MSGIGYSSFTSAIRDVMLLLNQWLRCTNPLCAVEALQLFCSSKARASDVHPARIGGKRWFVWLPTGYGKSLCYEILPFVFDYQLNRRQQCCTGSVTTAFADDGPSGCIWCSGREGRLDAMLTTLRQTSPM